MHNMFDVCIVVYHRCVQYVICIQCVYAMYIMMCVHGISMSDIGIIYIYTYI